MENHEYFRTPGILKVKFDENCSLGRIYQLNNAYWNMRFGRCPEIYHYLASFLSILPECVLNRITRYNIGSAIGVTNLVGPTNSVSIGGQRVLRKYAYFGLQWRHASKTISKKISKI